MKKQRQEMKSSFLSISYLLIVLMIAALTACGGLKGPMISKSSIPADIDAGVKMEIEKLYSSFSSKRSKGAYNLGIIGKEAAPAVPFLLDMLKDKEEDVRESVAIALGKIGDLSAVEPLIAALLKDKYEDVRKSAAWALGNIKEPRAIEPLITALKNNKRDEEVQMNAAWALGNIKDTRAVEPLIAALKLIAESSDEEKLVGKNAAWALGNIGDPRAIEPLISAMKDEEKGLKGKAVMGYVGSGLALLSGSLNTRSMIRSTNMLVDIKRRDRGELWSVAWALADIGKPAVEPLIVVLKNKDLHEDIRRRSPVALGRIGDSRAVEPLIAVLKDKDEDVRLSTAIALGNIKDPRAVEPLIAALNDKNKDVRGSVAIALWKIGDLRAVEPLIALLKDEDKDLRWDAAEALGNTKDPRVIELLVSTLKELTAEVKDEHWMVRKTVAERLGMIGKPAVEFLISFLKDENNQVRLSAVKALGNIKDPRSVEPLIAVLNDKDKDVRGSVAIALGNIGDPRAIEPLIALLKDESVYVRKSAKEALGNISGNNLGYDHAKWQAWWAENKNKQAARPEQLQDEANQARR